MSETRTLAQFAARLRYADLPAAVAGKAQELAQHAWGVQLAGSTLPVSQAACRYVVAQGGTAESTVVNHALRTSAVNAAFLNGVFGHAFEMDDNHAPTSIKGGCVVVPAALAIGERQRSSGREFLAALAAGYEVMVRVALSVMPVMLQRGHQPTGTCGAFGAAVVAGRLLGFDEKTMLHALSIAAAHTGGLVEAPASGRGDLKRIYGGMAAANGIRAALLAMAGVTGPQTMLEGEKGFCRAFGDAVNLRALTANLGSEWQLPHAHYKIYAQDGFLQPMTQALERIVERHKFAPQDVAEVRVGASREAQYWVGVIREPADLTSAQFSASFSLALFLVKRGAGFAEYTEDSLRDPAILELSRRIRMEVDDEIETEFQKTRPRGARVTVRLRSGQTHTELVPALRAMTAEQLERKFMRLAGAALEPARAERLMAAARELPALRDVSSIAALLCREAA